MAVSLWAVLGIVLWILGLPFAALFVLHYPTGSLGFMAGLLAGSGTAFLGVAGVRWILDRNRTVQHDDVDSEPLHYTG